MKSETNNLDTTAANQIDPGIQKVYHKYLAKLLIEATKNTKPDEKEYRHFYAHLVNDQLYKLSIRAIDEIGFDDLEDG